MRIPESPPAFHEPVSGLQKGRFAKPIAWSFATTGGIFDIQQVRVQFSGQVLCDRCSQTCNPEPGRECPDFERKQP
jgi:hypothetical protein